RGGGQQRRLLDPPPAHQNGPSDACVFVSKRNGSALDRPPLHQMSEPQPLRAVLARISDDSHGAGDEQPAQMSIALLRDPAKSLFAPGRMLSGHQADPRSKTAARRELLPISHLSHQRGGDDRADTGDFLQPSAFFTRAVPVMDTFLNGHDLCPDSRILASKDVKAEPRGRRNTIILLVSDDLEQFGSAIAALCRDNAELGHMPTDCIRQHRSLTNQKLPAAMQHQARLLLFRLRRHKPHRWMRDRFADCGSVVGVVFAALQIGFYVARRQQPHPVAERLKPAAPIMCARTCLNADEAGWQARKELQKLPPANAVAHYPPAINIYAVNLKKPTSRYRDRSC